MRQKPSLHFQSRDGMLKQTGGTSSRVSKVELWIFVIPPSLQDFVDELHEIQNLIILVEFGVLLRLELLGVRDDQFSRSILRLSFVSVHQARS